jgi:hypothetical protein
MIEYWFGRLRGGGKSEVDEDDWLQQYAVNHLMHGYGSDAE